MSFTNEPANSAVLGYMKSQNRPYSVQNVFDNLRGEIGKAKVALAMDAGVEAGVLVSKCYGAQKIYCVKQESAIGEETGPAALETLKSRLRDTTETVGKVRTQLEVMDSELSQRDQLAAALIRESQLVARLADLRAEIATVQSRRNTVEESGFSGEELHKSLESTSRELSRRSTIVREMMGLISEQCEMSRDEIIEELGLETESVSSPSRGS